VKHLKDLRVRHEWERNAGYKDKPDKEFVQ
jgi:hypothetical protein